MGPGVLGVLLLGYFILSRTWSTWSTFTRILYTFSYLEYLEYFYSDTLYFLGTWSTWSTFTRILCTFSVPGVLGVLLLGYFILSHATYETQGATYRPGSRPTRPGERPRVPDRDLLEHVAQRGIHVSPNFGTDL